ncbi:MAG: fumarylacetoacetate hydrolase family protein, partial [Brevundimonas sp.]
FDPEHGKIELTVNGEVKQSADLADLIWPVADIVSYLSGLWEIQPGDLIYTGTPAGVGAVVEGDAMVVTIDGLTPLNIKVGPPAA